MINVLINVLKINCGLIPCSCVEKIIQSMVEAELLDDQNYSGDTALHISSANGETVISKLLIARGAALNIQNNDTKRKKPLYLAIKNFHDKTCDVLVDAVVRTFNDPDVRKRILLDDMMFAAYRGMLDIVAKLLLYIDVNVQQDSTGNTVLHRSAENGRDGTVQMLLEKGACVHIKNVRYKTPGDLARNGSYDNVLIVLSEFGLCKCGRANCPDSKLSVEETNEN